MQCRYGISLHVNTLHILLLVYLHFLLYGNVFIHMLFECCQYSYHLIIHVARGGLPALTREPLYIGAGADPRTQRVLPLYTGQFDSVSTIWLNFNEFIKYRLILDISHGALFFFSSNFQICESTSKLIPLGEF